MEQMMRHFASQFKAPLLELDTVEEEIECIDG